MECPACHDEVRLTEPAPASLANAYVYVTCPANRCNVVAHLGDEPSLLTVKAAHRLAKNMTKATARFEWILAGVVTVAAVAFFLFLGVLQLFAPGDRGTMEVIAVFLFGAVGVVTVAAVMFGGFYLDELIAREKWRERLPHATLSFAVVPKAYRA